MPKRDTKSLLLEHGLQLLLQRGYNNTGIHDVLLAAKTPKGSFYHFFESKEEFGLQILEQYAESAYLSLEARLSDESIPPVKRVKKFFQDIFAGYKDKGCKEGCLLGNLGQELSEINDTFRKTVADNLNRWAKLIAQCLREAQKRGELSKDIKPREMANLLIDGFEGAALRMKLVRNDAPLKAFMRLYFDQLLIP